jgi:hypothetical protein
MNKRLLSLVFSISPMMLVGCGTMQSQSEAPLTIQLEEDCVWVDTPEDVLAGYEWTGVVTGDYVARDTDLYLHCWTGNHPAQ